MRKLLMAAAVALGTVAGAGAVDAAPVALPLGHATAGQVTPAVAGSTDATEARVQTVQYRRYHRRHYRRHYRGRYYR